MLNGMFRHRAISFRISCLNSAYPVAGCSALICDGSHPSGPKMAMFGSNSIVAIGSTSAASPPGGAIVFMKTAMSAADSAAAMTASVYRLSWAKRGNAGRMSGRPRDWPGRSARNQWIIASAGTRS